MNFACPNSDLILQEALRHANAGWSVIPLYGIDAAGRCRCGKECPSPGKHPRLKKWKENASRDVDRIRNWYTKWPDSNIGIVTGPESGLIVLDVDGEDGERSLDGWQSETLIAQTGRGRHYYFKSSTALRNSAGKLGPGLDVRGQGGYIVAPGSRHVSGATYNWINPAATLQSAPAWLLASNPIPNGQRNSTLHKLASAMRGRGSSREEILVKLLAVNMGRCAPPLPGRELEHIADSTAKYGVGQESRTPAVVALPRQTLGDFLVKELPKKEALIDGVLYQSDRISLTGRRREGKTTLLCNIALAGGLGLPQYLGFLIPKPFNSVNFYLEDDAGELQAKLARMRNGQPIIGKVDIYTREDFYRGNTPVDAGNQNFCDQVLRLCEAAQPDLVIFDNLGHLIGADYNNPPRIHKLIEFIFRIGNDFNAAVLIAAHPRKKSRVEGQKGRSISLAKAPEEFFEECTGSSHFINSTGSLWGVERNFETETTRLLLGTQRLTGTHTMTVAAKDEHDWFQRVDDFVIAREHLLNTPGRKRAWDLLPPGEFSYGDAKESAKPGLKSSGSFNPWWRELQRQGLIVTTRESRYRKAG